MIVERLNYCNRTIYPGVLSHGETSPGGNSSAHDEWDNFTSDISEVSFFALGPSSPELQYELDRTCQQFSLQDLQSFLDGLQDSIIENGRAISTLETQVQQAERGPSTPETQSSISEAGEQIAERNIILWLQSRSRGISSEIDLVSATQQLSAEKRAFWLPQISLILSGEMDNEESQDVLRRLLSNNPDACEEWLEEEDMGRRRLMALEEIFTGFLQDEQFTLMRAENLFFRAQIMESLGEMQAYVRLLDEASASLQNLLGDNPDSYFPSLIRGDQTERPLHLARANLLMAKILMAQAGNLSEDEQVLSNLQRARNLLGNAISVLEGLEQLEARKTLAENLIRQGRMREDNAALFDEARCQLDYVLAWAEAYLDSSSEQRIAPRWLLQIMTFAGFEKADLLQFMADNTTNAAERRSLLEGSATALEGITQRAEQLSSESQDLLRNLIEAHFRLAEMYRYLEEIRDAESSREHYEATRTLVEGLPEQLEERSVLLARICLGLARLEESEGNFSQAYSLIREAHSHINSVPDDIAREIRNTYRSLAQIVRPGLSARTEVFFGSDRRIEAQLQLGVDFHFSLIRPSLRWLNASLREQIDFGTDASVATTYLRLDFRPINPLTIGIQGRLGTFGDAEDIRFFRRPDLLLNAFFWHEYFGIGGSVNLQFSELRQNSYYATLMINFAWARSRWLRGLQLVILEYNSVPFTYLDEFRRRESFGFGVRYEANATNWWSLRGRFMGFVYNSDHNMSLIYGSDSRQWDFGWEINIGSRFNLGRYLYLDLSYNHQQTDEYSMEIVSGTLGIYF